jgi:DNA-binding IclR family transcriptional regulator
MATPRNFSVIKAFVVLRAFQNPFPIHTRVGAQLEAYCSGLGKILLAAKPQEEIERFIQERTLVPLTPYTITSAARLREELDRVDNCGQQLIRHALQNAAAQLGKKLWH